MKLSWMKKPKMNDVAVAKLINYIPEQIEQMNEVAEATDYSFTEVQKLINEFFFSDEDHLDEVFGEEEDEDEDEDEDTD
jgi:hypothetical protein